MPELNKANRQTCDVDIRALGKDSDGAVTKTPFLFIDYANTTTAGLSGEVVNAMAKGTPKIAFQNPIKGTISISAQVYPFKLFSLYSDGTIESTASYAVKKKIKCNEAGKITIKGSAAHVFAFPEGEYGEETKIIEGTAAASGSDTLFTADGLEANKTYEVGYIVTKTSGVKKITFNNNKLPKDYYITMQTLDKDEAGLYTPFIITAYKASIQRNFELSFSSEGDPASVTLTFDLTEDKDGNVLDIIEAPEDEEDITGDEEDITGDEE